ncbi:TB2/DP1, HVA22 family-domain-containing protein [Russula earlei]|uniref:TB2/DP1, HVA22 family-domain-containing protein n=1 Tax=Russula earlei TaxID=71964 RepID=A0ACC0TWA3_9AGAM|nr:TB2/DP1, HVA22 family-domain-containing protein [Russula earlei]
MFLYLTSRLVSGVAAFLYPGYASFKTLSQRPASEEDLERWLMYWSVLACAIGVEYLVGWVVSWIPFYHLFKTIFLLYLAIPQTQGASYLYRTQLDPVLRAHEHQIDAALAQLRARVFSFLHARARMIWDSIIASATGPQSAPTPETLSGSSGQAPALSDSVSGPTQMLGTLWRTYGPTIVAGGTALLQRQGVAPSNSRTSATKVEPLRGYDVGDGTEPIPMPRVQSHTSYPEASGGLRPRVASSTNIGPGGRFEEIEVPSDAEGDRPDTPPRRSSGGWFSWVTASPTHAKTD